jgi:cell wall-associated NlpC family hydrolase
MMDADDTLPMMTPAAIVAQARDYVGVPWRHQGRSRAGVDCVGLVLAVARDFGLPVPAVDDYGWVPDGARMLALCEAHLQPVAPHAKQLGDILLINAPRLHLPRHVALFAGETIIHAYNLARQVVEVNFASPWPESVQRVYRLPGVVVMGGGA